MKKALAASLALALLISAAVPALAVRFSSLSELQRFLLKKSPDTIAATAPHSVDIFGTVQEIRWCGANNHYELTLRVDDPDALAPIGAGGPQLVVHFRLHREQLPAAVGDTIAVSGSLNELYSSVMVPWILAGTINGSSDF